ncbi:GNAT family N-acetyltransferase [Ancylobacter pratisalsi]|uniref:GNAT family N-acetyltransferase n=1 Tax=Ancylobacter pratisalsi TaxID=1745854 RepID=A0A6P1YL44_9HYPH|nr:GNAT family N-acetyltransferase [Ancylobacter pratisalsi]QIB33416.1 GNAT family N-acetyltransferase [Ancylobacter pratisalsi]
MSLTIRPAAPGDAGLVLALVRELADYEKLLHEVEASEADLARDLFGDQPRVFCDIAEWQGEPAGLALWFYNYSTFRGRHGLYLEDLFVRPAFRGRGIAKGVMRHLAKRCIDEGLGRFEWWVLNWNEPAIRFYRSIGAAPMTEWTVQRVTGEALAALAGK